MNKQEKRLRRARKTRIRIGLAERLRLSVHRTPRHIYAQIIDDSKSVVLVSASTLALKNEIKGAVKYTGNIDAAKIIGQTIAERAVAAGIKKVAFDRSGFKYHGRVRALAQAAREHGLEF